MGQHCNKNGCPGDGFLGYQPGSLHSPTQDPLFRCLNVNTTTCNLGGAAAVHTKIESAMHAFIDQSYPNLGNKDILTVVPDLPEQETGMTMADMMRNMHSSMGRHGGLLEGHQDIPTVLADPTLDPKKKKTLEEMQKKYGGERGEVEVMTAVMNAMAGQEGLVMLGHKTALSLVEDIFRKELEKKTLSDEDRNMEVVEKLFSYIGVTLDKPLLQAETKKDVLQYFGKLGPQAVVDIENTIAVQRAITDGNKWDREKRRRDMDTLQRAVDDSKASSSPNSTLDPLSPLLQAKTMAFLNKMKREHDITIVRPEFKTVAQIEVKAVGKDKTKRHKIVLESALKQLKGGKEELKRMHGHLLDTDWSYIGFIALTNLTSKDRDAVC
jgi:2C-methyl-D-erythritol 2,4-cyclodiphosphate synthase